MSESVLAIIPARGGSKGIPRKNIALLGGKPLIAYTIECAIHAGCFDNVVVSTDDEEIRRISLGHGAEVPFMRPAELASDKAKAIPMMQHAVRESENFFGNRFEIITMLQPTSPLKSPDDLRGAIHKLLGNPAADAIISVADVEGYHPGRMKYLEGNVLVDPPFVESHENQPRQELRPMYIRNGAIYACRRSVLMEKNTFKGDLCLAWIMPSERSINIDSIQDLDYADWLLNRSIT
jgi:CMP-N-acetylneuraminic acid synthetase